ncbi:hypothetical protein ZWY2020_018480 [Hordeum vulgare]|nr:hypothetical protein ZWY2020_018480 [Hordeum vulgare]
MAPGCSSCGRAPATRVALNMPMCEACFGDILLMSIAQIDSMLPSPVPSYAQTGNVRPEHGLAGNVSQSPVPTPSNVSAPQGQQQFRDSVAELLAATEPSPVGSQRAARSNCEACRLSGDKACMFCHNPGPPPPPAGQS